MFLICFFFLRKILFAHSFLNCQKIITPKSISIVTNVNNSSTSWREIFGSCVIMNSPLKSGCCEQVEWKIAMSMVIFLQSIVQ